MLLPYRVKNPPKTLPIATLFIIFINVIVYIFTTDNLLEIKESVVLSWAYAPGKMPFLNFISAAFLHGDIFHIAGNMLFLWVFGPSVEDRLGIPKYLGVYFATGLCGDFLQAAMDLAMRGEPSLGIGASGCIMGILGAYWFIYSWSTVCVAYWFGWFWHGVWEVEAIWIIGIYFLMDLFQGMLFGSIGVSGGVANFAHVGGAAGGALLCLLLRTKRDTAEMSEAKAIQADMKDLSLMPFHSLQTMLEHDPNNLDLIRAMIKPAINTGHIQTVHDCFARVGDSLIDKDPEIVIYYLTILKGNANIYQPGHILRMAGQREREGDYGQALQLYRILVESHATASEVERALYGLAACYWRAHKDVGSARTCLAEMAKRFPNGSMTPYGKKLWEQISGGRA